MNRRTFIQTSLKSSIIPAMALCGLSMSTLANNASEPIIDAEYINEKIISKIDSTSFIGCVYMSTTGEYYDYLTFEKKIATKELPCTKVCSYIDRTIGKTYISYMKNVENKRGFSGWEIIGYRNNNGVLTMIHLNENSFNSFHVKNKNPEFKCIHYMVKDWMRLHYV